MLIPMRSTFSILRIAPLLLAFLGTGCESASTTPANGQSAASPEPAQSSNPESRDVAQRPKGVWPGDIQSQSGKRIEIPDPIKGDSGQTTAKDRVEMEEEVPPEKDPPLPETWKALNKEKTLYFEKTADDKRRVHLLTSVCLREGPLEVLVCKQSTKEHEAILTVDVDARDIHFALIAAGAKPGTTVRFVPEYKSATGDIIRVTLTYHKDGKLQSNKPAQSWLQHVKTKKDLEHDWVFAGSRFFKFPDEPNRPPFYCANNGEIISVANFSDSMLDLPVMSSKEASELGYFANKDRIPPLKTKVIVTLELLKKG